MGVDIVGDPHREDNDGYNWTLLSQARNVSDVTPGSTVVMGSVIGRYLAKVVAWDFEVSDTDPIVVLDLCLGGAGNSHQCADQPYSYPGRGSRRPGCLERAHPRRLPPGRQGGRFQRISTAAHADRGPGRVGGVQLGIAAVKQSVSVSESAATAVDTEKVGIEPGHPAHPDCRSSHCRPRLHRLRPADSNRQRWPQYGHGGPVAFSRNRAAAQLWRAARDA